MANFQRLAFSDFTARKGMKPDQMREVFSKVASTYDDTVKSMNYMDHVYIADAVTNHYNQNRRQTIKILDVAAGTGMLAEELWKKGFRNIDGLDPSEGMMNEAMKKHIYTNYHQQYMDGKQIASLNTDDYDCLVVAAAFNTGLLPCLALLEMVRLVKPDGLMCFGILDVRFTEVEEYNTRLEPLMSLMEDDGLWKLHDKTHYKEFYDNSGPGTVYRYVVKVSDLDTTKYNLPTFTA